MTTIKATWGILAYLLLLECYFSEEVIKNKLETTDLAYETFADNRLLIFSLLDGSFVALDRSTGDIVWKHSSKSPVVSVPNPSSAAIQPLYIPDPRDGSIYVLSVNYNLPAQPVRKLPFTIAELVAASPCRSSDSILYTGSKRDSWLRLDRRTGEMREVLGWEDDSNRSGSGKGSTCPVDSVSGKFQVYLGRTQYTVLMIDSRNESRRWNVSFSQYNAPPMSADDLTSYEHLHLTSSSSGHVMTVDRRTGALLWCTVDIGAPVVAAYLLDELVGGLLQVPFTSASAHTLKAISERGLNGAEDDHRGGGQVWVDILTHQKLYPTLYIGLHIGGGLYAIPSLLERPGLTLSDIGGLPLTTDGAITDADGPLMLLHNFGGKNEGRGLYLGHYHVPDYVPEQYPLQVLQPPGTKQPSTAGYITHVQPDNKNPSIAASSGRVVGPLSPPVVPVVQGQQDDVVRQYYDHLTVRNLVRHLYAETKQWLDGQENKAIKLTLIVVVGCVVAMAWYVRMQVQEMRQISQNGSSNPKQQQQQQQYLTNSDGADGTGTTSISLTELLDSGDVRVGKIQFNPNDVLGKGCEGTFVYRGTFDGRQVAVKRLLPECFSLADREVALLRESDAHAHVVRYYCTEQDRLFRYIALELCDATLYDYVTGKWWPPQLVVTATDSQVGIDLIKQVVLGVEHLHSLNIVHRDIKPHNVLLVVAQAARVGLRAMISDFGLCKKVAEGHVSFSRRSGVTGTDGWMAPEIFQLAALSDQQNRPTLSVDLFSVGCLVYYVLTWGGHPFGEPLHRQANIQSNRCQLNQQQKQHNWPLWRHLLISLLRPKNESHLRPPCHVLLHHPALWSAGKVLEFLQDVSDCVERRCRRETDMGGATNPKATLHHLIYADNTPNGGITSWREQLEEAVVRSDWRAHVDGVVVEDLRKYRTYQGTNVRDLLRAIRNKRNHYRELSTQAQETLGAPPTTFTQYWTGRFPHLVLYTWLALQHATSDSTDASNDASVRSHYYNSPGKRAEYFPLNRDVVRNGTMQLHLTDSDRQLAETYRQWEEEERLAKELEQQNKKRYANSGGTPKRRYHNKRTTHNESAGKTVLESATGGGDRIQPNWRSRSSPSNYNNNNVS